MTIQRSSAEIAAELTLYRAARTQLVTGRRVEDVWRDGRRMRLGALTMTEVEQAIASLEREYEAAVAVEGGQTRRRAIGLGWKN